MFGNAYKTGKRRHKKAQKIRREASNFIQNDPKLDFVYDYMFHLFSTEYSKLMRYQPTIPQKAEEGRVKKFMLDSMVMILEYMPPTFGHFAFKRYLEKKCKSMKQVE
ncbi:hypothetical protein BUALT_Bualt06G0111000 [Buddleja alternifolia]|uniref:Glycosyl transferase CAP10 domain-containing protein n=1 Tax=Buddleja alternifolia TaxID=168488 RepID=A0AAV6XG04_9LAMI|nr:hypothetical protein BUALT_Bualt06G0111000 [Buddleja alternifolia]